MNVIFKKLILHFFVVFLMDLASYQSSDSLTGTHMIQKSQNQIETKPFSQQFDYHLQDVPIQRRKKNFIPDGIILIFCPGIKEFEVYYRKREPIEELRQMIEEKIKI